MKKTIPAFLLLAILMTGQAVLRRSTLWATGAIPTFRSPPEPSWTLQQIKADRPTQDYDGLWGTNTDQFLEAAYPSLGK